MQGGLTTAQQKFLDTVCDSFASNGTWPAWGDFTRMHAREIGSTALLPQLEPHYIHIHRVLNVDCAVLTPYGLARCRNGPQILETLHRALKLASEIYVGPPASSNVLSRPEAAQRLSLSELQATQLGSLLSELPIGEFFGTSTGHWNLAISEAVLSHCPTGDTNQYIRELSDWVPPKKKPHAEAWDEGRGSATEGGRASHVPNTAFILMWMQKGDPFLESVLKAVKDCCASFEIDAERADDIEHQDVVMQVVLERIRRSEYVICDLTGERPNVYYELGYAHALGKRPVLLRRKGTALHFDIQGYNIIDYTDAESLQSLLARRFEALTGRKPRQQP